MAHPAIDDAAIERLTGRAPVPSTSTALVPVGDQPQPSRTEAWQARAKAWARRAAEPVLAKLRDETEAHVRGELDELRSEVVRLRRELAATRAELEAELAVTQAEQVARRGTAAPAPAVASADPVVDVTDDAPAGGAS